MRELVILRDTVLLHDKEAIIAVGRIKGKIDDPTTNHLKGTNRMNS